MVSGAAMVWGLQASAYGSCWTLRCAVQGLCFHVLAADSSAGPHLGLLPALCAVGITS